MKINPKFTAPTLMNVKGVLSAKICVRGSAEYVTITNFLSSINANYEIELLEVFVEKGIFILMLVDREVFEYDKYVIY